jgi:hypothetical protein
MTIETTLTQTPGNRSEIAAVSNGIFVAANHDGKIMFQE